MDDLYHEHILDHAQAPRNFGELSSELITHSGEAKNVSCGDSLSVQIATDPQGKIQQISWKGEGCAISMAAASILSERAVGQPVERFQGLQFAEILEALGLDTLSPARIKCATLFVNAMQNIHHV
jgi:nitrogen fixation NifU-like protein